MKRLIGIVALAAWIASPVVTTACAASSKSKEQRVHITVTPNGFEPAQVKLHAGRRVRLVVTRRTDRTCATEIVLKDLGIQKALPLNQPVEIVFTPRKTGSLRYACGMDMIAGKLVIQ
jgi:plastocyanin domain-containing protein